MAINFPNSPTLDQTFSSGNNTYIWNGNAWVGYSTITSSGGTVVSSQWGTVATGIHTLSNVGIGTTNATSALTVKGNTSLETLNVSGITTFNNTVNFGPGGYISTSTNNLNIEANTDVVIHGYYGGTKITSQPGANLVFVDAVGGDVSLYYQTSAGPSGSEKRLQTLGTGVTVTGTTFTNQLNVSGVSTFNNRVDVAEAIYLGTVGGNAAFRISRFGGTNNFESTGGAFNFTGGSVSLGAGATVTGTTFTNQLSVSGISNFNGSVGIATTNSQTPLQVESIYGVKTGTGTFTAAVGVAQTIDSFTISQTDFKTAEYTIHVGFGTYIQSQKVLVMQNGTTAYSQEYAIMYHPELVVSIGATITGGQLRLQATPESGITGLTTYRFVRQSML